MRGLLRTDNIILVLLVAILAYWVWAGLGLRSILADEAISILSIEGITNGGTPLLPSGYLYGRGYVPSYLTAGVASVFGLNNFTIMFPSLLAALGSLYLVYLFARDVLGKPWVGIAAVILLVVLQIQTLYATSPRMYMTLQFFAMLSIYGAWRGYVEDGKKWWQLVTLLAIAGAILTHREGTFLLFSIPLSILIVTLIKGESVRQFFSRINIPYLIVGLIAIIVGILIGVGYTPEFPQITANVGSDPETVDLNFNVIAKVGRFVQLEEAPIFVILFVPVALFLIVNIVAQFARGRREDVDKGSLYISLVFGFTSWLVMTVLASEGRFILFIIPLFAILAVQSLVVFIDLVNSALDRVAGIRLIRNKTYSQLLAAVVILVVVLGVFAIGSRGPGVLTRAAGFPCQTSECHRDLRVQHDALAEIIAPGDTIISSNPFITRFYIGRVDGFLREKILDDGSYVQYDSPTDEYLGIPIIDSIDELQELLDGENRVWIVADFKATWASSPETRDFLSSQFIPFIEHDISTTYVNCLEAPCKRAQLR